MAVPHLSSVDEVPRHVPMDSAQADAFSLRGRRLILRPWRLDDLTAFLPIVQDPMVMRYIGPGHTWDAETTSAFILRQMTLQHRVGFCLWVMESAEQGQLMGYCGGRPFEPPPDQAPTEAHPDHASAASETVEIGWRLAQGLWGKGFATEAATLVVDHLLNVVGVRRLVATARIENWASIRVMEKIGMQYHGSRLRDGVEVVQYALIR